VLEFSCRRILFYLSLSLTLNIPKVQEVKKPKNTPAAKFSRNFTALVEKLQVKASSGFHSRHFYSAAVVATAFRAIGVYPGKMATPRSRSRVGGVVASVLGTLTARPPRVFKFTR